MIRICTVFAALGARYATRIREDTIIEMRGDIARLKEEIRTLRDTLDDALGEEKEDEENEDVLGGPVERC